jgi:hypothetical protein
LVAELEPESSEILKVELVTSERRGQFQLRVLFGPSSSLQRRVAAAIVSVYTVIVTVCDPINPVVNPIPVL